MPEFKKDPNELGVLWIKTSGRGEYMTWTINGEPVVVFRNEHKKDSNKAPDWRVMKPKPKAAVSADHDVEF